MCDIYKTDNIADVLHLQNINNKEQTYFSKFDAYYFFWQNVVIFVFLLIHISIISKLFPTVSGIRAQMFQCCKISIQFSSSGLEKTAEKCEVFGCNPSTLYPVNFTTVTWTVKIVCKFIWNIIDLYVWMKRTSFYIAYSSIGIACTLLHKCFCESLSHILRKGENPTSCEDCVYPQDGSSQYFRAFENEHRAAAGIVLPFQ